MLGDPPNPGEGSSEEAGSLHVRTGDRGLAMGWFYALSVYLSRVAAVTLFEPRLINAHRMPRSGPAVFAGNHQSVLDPWLLGLSLARRACYLARDSLFRVPILGWLIRKYDSMPVPRESAAPRRALAVCIEILEKGRALILFPEGTRSRDGRLQPLKRGIALIARRTGAPVVPVLVRGTYSLWPRSRVLPRSGQVRLVFGRSVTFEPSESSDSFMERLSAAYQGLALEEGAVELLPEKPRAEGGAAAAPTSINAGGRTALLEAAGRA